MDGLVYNPVIPPLDTSSVPPLSNSQIPPLMPMPPPQPQPTFNPLSPDSTKLINVIHRAVLEKLTEQGAVPLPLTPDQLRVSVECVAEAVKNSMKGRDLLNDRLAIQREATIRSFTEIPQAIYKASQGQTLPTETTSGKSAETQKEGFLPIDDLVAEELRKRNDQDTKLGVNPPPLGERKLNVINVPFKSTLQTPEMDDIYKPLDPQNVKYINRPSNVRERVVSLVPAPAPAPAPAPEPVTTETNKKPSLIERRQARLELLKKIKEDKEKNLNVSPQNITNPVVTNPIVTSTSSHPDMPTYHRTIISSPPGGIDVLRWDLETPSTTDGKHTYNITELTRLQIPRILFNGYMPYILLRIRCQEEDTPKIYNIPMFQIPSAISDGMTNWKPDNHSLSIYTNSVTTSSITFMICTPDGDTISLLSSEHTRFTKNITQASRFITGYSKQSSPDIVYPISEIDTKSTETFKYNLQSHAVNLFISVKE